MNEILFLDIIFLILCLVSYESREVESSLRIKNGLKTQLKISNMGKWVKTEWPRADRETPLVASMLVSEIKLSASGHSIWTCEAGVSSVWMVEWAVCVRWWWGNLSAGHGPHHGHRSSAQSLIRSLHSNNNNSNPLTDNTDNTLSFTTRQLIVFG